MLTNRHPDDVIGRARHRGAGHPRRANAGGMTIDETAVLEVVTAAVGVVVLLLAEAIGLALAAVETTLSAERRVIDAVLRSLLLQR